VRFGHQCDGYSNKSPSKLGSPSSKSSRTLVPKSPTQSPLSPATSYTSSFSPVSSCSTIKLCPSPPRNLFQTQYEHEAFQTFCTRTSYQLSSAFSSDLWTRLMVQACETEPSIRHAVIAIGALNLTSPLPRPESSVGTLKHNFAYRQYSKALCLLRRDVLFAHYTNCMFAVLLLRVISWVSRTCHIAGIRRPEINPRMDDLLL
jgi:hypothetical protein